MMWNLYDEFKVMLSFPFPQTHVILELRKHEMFIWRNSEARPDVCHAGHFSKSYTI